MHLKEESKVKEVDTFVISNYTKIMYS